MPRYASTNERPPEPESTAGLFVLRQGRVWHLALLGLMTVAHAQQPSFLWAKPGVGPARLDVSISESPGGICVGPKGEITVVGQFYQTAVFGNRTLTAKGVNPGELGFEGTRSLSVRCGRDGALGANGPGRFTRCGVWCALMATATFTRPANSG